MEFDQRIFQSLHIYRGGGVAFEVKPGHRMSVEAGSTGNKPTEKTIAIIAAIIGCSQRD
jgi:hypothetical protein